MDSQKSIPKHIAVIMDGNGRWAKKRFLPRAAGHKVGVKSARKLVQLSAKKGVEVLTLFAFSSENWLRPAEEVRFLMNLYVESLRKEAKELHQNNVQLQIIGNRVDLSQKLQDAILEVESLTQHNTGLKIRVALNYGSQWEITEAAKKLAKAVQSGDLQLDDITQQDFENQLTTAGLPNVDLLVRTSGEARISNFLLWQIAYAELYFTEVPFPDFNETEFEKALASYQSRQRRFGKISEQVEGA